MKLLILITLTLTINFSVIMKSSFFNSPKSTITIIESIDKQRINLYHQGKDFVNNLTNTVMVKFSKYSKFVRVAILGNSNFKKEQPLLIKSELRYSSGDSGSDISKKVHPCFL